MILQKFKFKHRKIMAAKYWTKKEVERFVIFILFYFLVWYGVNYEPFRDIRDIKKRNYFKG